MKMTSTIDTLMNHKFGYTPGACCCCEDAAPWFMELCEDRNSDDEKKAKAAGKLLDNIMLHTWKHEEHGARADKRSKHKKYHSNIERWGKEYLRQKKYDK